MRQRHLHYGWVVVCACILIEGAGQGILLNTFNVFIKPVTDSLGFSRGLFAAYSTICTGVSVVLLPWYGKVLQGPSAKRVIQLCAFVTVLVPLGYSVSSRLIHFYLLAVVSGIFINGVGMAMAGTVVGYWFQEKRGLATGIAFAGSGIMGSIAVPLITAVISAYGWRVGYRVVSLAAFLLYLPALMWLLKIRPEECGMRPYGVEWQESSPATCQGVSRKEAMSTPAMWLFLPAMFLATISTQAMYGNSLAYFSDLGYTTAVIGIAGSLMYAVLAIGRVGSGWIFDRMGALASVMMVSFLLLVTGVLFLCAGVSVGFVVAAVLVLGSVSGGVALIPSHWVRSCYGEKEFSSIYAIAMVPIQLALATGPLAGASIYDCFGSYSPAWIMGIVAAAVAWILFVISYQFQKKEKRNETGNYLRKAAQHNR